MWAEAKILFEYADKSTKIITRRIRFRYNVVNIYDELNYQYQYEAYKKDDWFDNQINKYKYTIYNEILPDGRRISSKLTIILLEINYHYLDLLKK